MGMLFGFKAIALHPELTSASKIVGAIVLDHYNKRTGQCDPSIDRLTRLSGLNKSSVIRAIKELQKHGLIRKISHGGGHERNKYMPCFREFYQADEKWRGAMKRKNDWSPHNSSRTDTVLSMPDSAELQPQGSQNCNISMRNVPTSDVVKKRNKPISITNTENLEDNCVLFSVPQGNVVQLDRNSKIARAAFNRAETRLTAQINKHPKSSFIWSNCSKKIHDEAARLEMKCRGKGIEFLISELAVNQSSK